MASIWEGSFVLGNTSATQISAGPGIKLDTSVPGVIGISNDETVLWEGTRNVTSITLNEAGNNFEFLKFIVTDPDGNFKQVNEIPGDSTINYLFMLQSTSTTAQIFRSIKIVTSNYLNYVMSEEQRTQFKSDNTMNWAVNYGAGVVKVVGINRIAGGN